METPFEAIFCRICHKASGDMHDIFEEVNSEEVTMHNMLLASVDMMVDPNDEYSNFLCNECACELFISYKFHKKCEQLTLQESANENLQLSNTTTSTLEEYARNDILQQLVEDLNIEFPYQQIQIPCEEVPEQADELIKLSVEKENLQSVFTCDICGANFERKHNLKRHLKNFHPNLQIFQCSICNYDTRSQQDYNSHISTCHQTEDNTCSKYVCNFCGKSLVSNSALQMHLRVHTNERPFSCDFCQKTFKTKSSLINHQQRHNSKPQYCCKLCQKNFYEKGNLKVHMRSHTGEKLHKCSDCGKEFARVFLLQLHRRTHTGEKPYQCQVCQSSFKQSGDLYKHQLLHRNLDCSLCGKKFKKRYLLKQHMDQGCCIEDLELDVDPYIEVNYINLL